MLFKKKLNKKINKLNIQLIQLFSNYAIIILVIYKKKILFKLKKTASSEQQIKGNVFSTLIFTYSQNQLNPLFFKKCFKIENRILHKLS